MKKISIFYGCALILLSGSALFSCKSQLNLEPEDALTPANSYQNVKDADRGVLGIYGQFMGLASQYIIWNELRADLMDVTANSDKDLYDISTHNVKAGNVYASPANFYTVINSCNDFLKNIGIMKTQNRLTQTEYNERYSDIASMRCLIYYQLGIHFGNIPYITQPVESIDDVNKLSSYPKIPLKQLVDSLVTCIENLPTPYIYSTFTGSVDGTDVSLYWMDRRFLLGELYLWKGEYLKAATKYKDVIEIAASGIRPGGSVVGSSTYSFDFHHFSFSGDAASTRTWIQRYRISLTDGSYFRDENVWCIMFDKRYSPYNKFVDLFSPIGGKYVLQPSVAAIDNWRVFPGGPTTGDVRGENGSWVTQNGKPVVYKFIYDYNATNIYEKPGRWWIWRQATLFLHYCEATNRCGYPYLPWVLLNGGMQTYKFMDATTPLDPPAVPPLLTDAHYKKTMMAYPFDFNGTTTNDATNALKLGAVVPAGAYLRNNGIRARAGVPILTLGAMTKSDSITNVENKLIDEGALELAFEGQRWSDLLRIAIRRNDPSFLANRVYQKFKKAGDPNAAAIQAKLMDPNNWFLPFP